MTDDASAADDKRSLVGRVKKFATDGLTRRTFLVLGGTAAAGAIVESAFGNALDAGPEAGAESLIAGAPDFIATLRRPEDQCVLTLAFYNLRPLYSNAAPVIEVIDNDQP